MNDLGPQPEIQSFLEKLKREREAKFNAQEIDNRPFLLKYVRYQNNIYLSYVLLLILVEIFVANCRHIRPSRCLRRFWRKWWSIVFFFLLVNTHLIFVSIKNTHTHIDDENRSTRFFFRQLIDIFIV